jgi:hypothetical protein
VNVRALITLGAVVALATPVTATAKLIPVKHGKAPGAGHVAKRPVAPRILCICSPRPVFVPPPKSEVELEAQVDVDLIAHSLDPLYASLQTTPALQAAYDAVLVSNGLTPYFRTA